MITPQDIQSKEFGFGVRGYKEDEVDSFLDALTIEMEKLIDENRKLTQQVELQNKELEQRRAQESTLLQTLEAAKALMGDISASAEKRAKILLKNAELDAELLQREAKESVERLTDENAALRNEYAKFKSGFRAFLEAEILKLDNLNELDIFEEKDLEDLNKIVDGETDTQPIRAK